MANATTLQDQGDAWVALTPGDEQQARVKLSFFGGIGHKGKCCANRLSIKRPVRKKVKIHGFAVTQPQRNGSAAIQYEPQL
jgi:hypothetical protein